MCIFENLILKKGRKRIKNKGLYMSCQNKISFPLNKFLLMGFLFCFVASYDILGQEVTEKEIIPLNQGYEEVEGADVSGLEEKPGIKSNNNYQINSAENKDEQS